MTQNEIKWLQRVYDGLVQASGSMDCIDPGERSPENLEIIEAINADLSRCFHALERILRARGALPDWCYQAIAEFKESPDGGFDIPF